MWGPRGVAILTCSAVVAVIGFTAAGHTAAAAATDSRSAPAAAVPVLLSRDKPVTASSSAGCCQAKNAVDGKGSTRWASVAGQDPQWLYVDLGGAAQISRIRLQWDKSCATAYELQTSTDHATWTRLLGQVTRVTGPPR